MHAILFLLDSLFIDTISSMGRFQGVVRIAVISLMLLSLPLQHLWAYYQGRKVDPWQGAICGASAGKCIATVCINSATSPPL